MRDKKLIVANWKMNFNTGEASLVLHDLLEKIESHRDVEVVIAPTTLSLQSLSLQIDNRKAKLAAQNFYWRDFGAYTGEVSAHQLRGLVKYAIVGHSERRHVFGEYEKDIRNKIQAAVRNHIRPILCIGETVLEREAGETRDVLQHQLTAGLANITSEEMEDVEIAYEPVWAIGTGDNAHPHDVQVVVKMIRAHIQHLFGRKIAQSVRVLYGGSVSQDSAVAYLTTEGIDGLLVGGASLEPASFNEIIKKAHGIENKGGK